MSDKKKIEYDESLFENSTVFGAAKANEKPKMKPAVKGFIFSAVALVVAAVVLVVALVIPKNDAATNTSSAVSTPTYSVTKIDEKKIDSVKVYNKNHPNGYSIIKEVSSTSSTTSSGTTPDYEWKVQGYEKYNLTGTQYLVKAALSMTSAKKYEKSADVLTADDLDISALDYSDKATSQSRFGFDKPWAAISAEGEDVSLTVVVGAVAPDKSGRYVTVSGDDNIYVVSENNMSYFDKHFNNMIGIAINDYILNGEGTSDYYDDGTLTRIDRLVLGGSCRKNTIRVESPDDDLSVISFVVTEPAFRAGNEENIGGVLDVATVGLVNDGAYVLGYTDADLQKYGLKNPFSTCEIVIGSYRVMLSFGPLTEDGYYPCIKEGSDVIYKVMKEGNEWIEYTENDLYFDSLFLEYITTVDSVSVKTDKHDVLFELAREDGAEPSDYTIKCDQAKKGVQIDRQQFNFYYGRILYLAAEEEIDSLTAEGEPFITFTITYTNKSRKQDVIALYKHSARRYQYTLNGKGNALVAASSVQDLYDCIDVLLKDEKIGRK